MERSERVTGNILQNIRLDGSGENKSEEIRNLLHLNRFHLEYSPTYDLESNRVAERFMKELGLRKRLLMKDSGMEEVSWAEDK